MTDWSLATARLRRLTQFLNLPRSPQSGPSPSDTASEEPGNDIQHNRGPEEAPRAGPSMRPSSLILRPRTAKYTPSDHRREFFYSSCSLGTAIPCQVRLKILLALYKPQKSELASQHSKFIYTFCFSHIGFYKTKSRILESK